MQNKSFLGAANFIFFQGSFMDAQEFLCCFALDKHLHSFPINMCLAVMQSDSDHVKGVATKLHPCPDWEKSDLEKYRWSSNTGSKLQTSTCVINTGDSRTTPIQTQHANPQDIELKWINTDNWAIWVFNFLPVQVLFMVKVKQCSYCFQCDEMQTQILETEGVFTSEVGAEQRNPAPPPRSSLQRSRQGPFCRDI